MENNITKNENINKLMELLKQAIQIVNGCEGSKNLVKSLFDSEEKSELKVMNIAERDVSNLLNYLMNGIKGALYEIEPVILEDSYREKRLWLTKYLQMVLDGLSNNLLGSNESINSLFYWFYILQAHQIIELITQLPSFNFDSILGLFTEYSMQICDNNTNEKVIILLN
jgi:hypothetical protein